MRFLADGLIQFLICYILSDFLVSVLQVQNSSYCFLALLLAIALSAASMPVFLPIGFLLEQGYKKIVLGFLLNVLFFIAVAGFDYCCRGAGIHVFIFEVYPLSASEGLLSILLIDSFIAVVILMRMIYCCIALWTGRKRRME